MSPQSLRHFSLEIPVPPKHTTKEFKSATNWGLRGKLDVPKERWVSFPGAEARSIQVW